MPGTRTVAGWRGVAAVLLPILLGMAAALLPILLGSAATPGMKGDDPTGATFSDPALRATLPAGWRQRPITREGASAQARLAVSLDQHLYPALLPLIEAFARQRGVQVTVQEGTCGISAGKLLQRKADMAGFCCPAGEADRLPGVAFHTLGIAALAILVHPGNPLAGLSLADIRRAFQGRVGYWRQLAPGAGFDPALALRVISRLHCKTRPGHWHLLLDNEDLFSPRAESVGSIPDMIAGVARQPGAIGYEVLWMTRRHADQGRVKTLAVDGVSPRDDDALAAGRYPLYRTFTITTWTDPPAHTALGDELAAFLLANAPHIGQRYGIVPVQRLRAAGWSFVGDELSGPPP